MNKEEYLYELKRYLQDFPEDEIRDILSDYEEHFSIGVSKGKTEEEISKELGSPEDIAKTYKDNYGDITKIDEPYEDSKIYTNSNNSSRKLLIGILLILFNIIVVLGPYMAIVGLILGIYGVGIGFIIGGFTTLIGSPLVFFTPIPVPHILTSLSIGIGLIALGALGLILGLYLSKLFIQLTIRYGKWNLNLINRQEVR